MMTKGKPVTIDEVFWIYGDARVDVCADSVWVRFDHEFVKVMNAKNMSAVALSKHLQAPWAVLNSAASRDSEPKWMTPHVISAMAGIGFDVMYVLTGTHQLSREEAALLDNYRNTTPERQASLREVGSAFAEPKLDIAADGTYAAPSRKRK